MNRRITRRQLLSRTARLGSALALPAVLPTGILGTEKRPGANERIRLGVVGLGARGQNLVGNLPGKAQVTALCDCSEAGIEGFFRPKGKFREILAPFLASEDARKCRKYGDVRRLLDREDLDGLIISTPDHHHAWMALRALEAGLDLYLEKPFTLTLEEGRQVVAATRRHRRVVQVGSQQRSMEMNQFACQFIREGGLGKLREVVVRNLPGAMEMPDLEGQEIPGSMDWDQFCGPRPLRPYDRRLHLKDVFRVKGLLWRGWDLWRDYSGHLMTNWGAHAMDMVQLALGRDGSGPVAIEVREPSREELVKLAAEWDFKTPTGELTSESRASLRRFWPVTLRYEDGLEVRQVPGAKIQTYRGEKGTLKMSRNRFQVDPPELVKNPPDPALAEKWKGAGFVARPHLENWLDCMDTRGEPAAPVEVGHRSNSVCLLVNLARQLGRDLKWDPATERFVGDDEANALRDRPRRPGFFPG